MADFILTVYEPEFWVDSFQSREEAEKSAKEMGATKYKIEIAETGLPVFEGLMKELLR